MINIRNWIKIIITVLVLAISVYSIFAYEPIKRTYIHANEEPTRHVNEVQGETRQYGYINVCLNGSTYLTVKNNYIVPGYTKDGRSETCEHEFSNEELYEAGIKLVSPICIHGTVYYEVIHVVSRVSESNVIPAYKDGQLRTCDNSMIDPTIGSS